MVSVEPSEIVTFDPYLCLFCLAMGSFSGDRESFSPSSLLKGSSSLATIASEGMPASGPCEVQVSGTEMN